MINNQGQRELFQISRTRSDTSGSTFSGPFNEDRERIFHLLLFACLSFAFYGCINTERIVIRDQHFFKKGLYETTTLNDTWARAPLGSVETWGHSPVVWDMVAVKCPGTQSISILTALVRTKGYSDSFEQTVMEFYTSANPMLKQITSYRSIKLGASEAIEIRYLSKESKRTLDFCKTVKPASLVFKDIVVNAGFKNGGWETVILSYSSPEETFDGAVKDFDEMVQAFHLAQ
jgi:hypothetical protein